MKLTTEKSEFFSTAELSAYLGVSQKFIVKHRASHRLPGASQVGSKWVYRKAEIEKRLLGGQLLLPANKG